MRFGAQTSFTVGACTYVMIPVDVVYGKDGELLYYLPELGFALVGAWGPSSERDYEVYTAIERVSSRVLPME